MKNLHARYMPHGLGDDSYAYHQFQAWMVREVSSGHYVMHPLAGKKGITVFALTPEEYLHFNTDHSAHTLQ